MTQSEFVTDAETDEPAIDIVRSGVVTFGYKQFSTMFQLLYFLEEHNIDMVVDIRSRPHTRRFSKDEFVNILGNKYISIPEMGGLYFERSEYDKWLKKAHKGLKTIAELQKNRRVGVMCMERNYNECHRYYFVGRALGDMGIENIRYM